MTPKKVPLIFVNPHVGDWEFLVCRAQGSGVYVFFWEVFFGVTVGGGGGWGLEQVGQLSFVLFLFPSFSGVCVLFFRPCVLIRSCIVVSRAQEKSKPIRSLRYVAPYSFKYLEKEVAESRAPHIQTMV